MRKKDKEKRKEVKAFVDKEESPKTKEKINKRIDVRTKAL